MLEYEAKNSNNIANQNNKIRTIEKLLELTQERFSRRNDFIDSSGKWTIVTPEEFDQLNSKPGKEPDDGIVVENIGISKATFSDAVRELQKEGSLIKDDNGYSYVPQAYPDEKKCHPILTLAPQITITETPYKFFRCYMIDSRYCSSVAAWLNQKFKNDHAPALCITVENFLFVLSGWSEKNKKFPALSKYLQSLFQEYMFDFPNK